MKKRFRREKYLSRIRPFLNDTGMIKVITGVRRCGKSCLLETIIEELISNGVSSENIIYIHLDRRPYKSVKTMEKLEKIIDEKAEKIQGIKYLFLDEIQNVKGFEESLNAYREEDEYSIFITGSNSYLLSGELVTKLTGRYLEFKMTTLTFDEYLGMKRFLKKQINPSIGSEFSSYIVEGGFPKALEYDSLPSKREYFSSVISEIYQKDINKNKRIRKKRLFNEIMNYIIANFGTSTSIQSLCDYVNKTKKEPVRKETIYRYVEQLVNLRIVDKCTRLDQKSKKALFGGEKYYLSDLSFYFYNRTDNKINYGPVLENIFYNYAKSLNYSISVGKIGNLEIDFVLRNPNLDYRYVQISKTIYEGHQDKKISTQEREYKPLEEIKDNYPKYLLTIDSLLQKRNGIIHANIAEFIAYETIP